MRRIRAVARDLFGSNEPGLVRGLEAQIDAVIAGAHLAADVSQGEVTSSDARQQITTIEHEGDRHRAGLIEALGRALVTPFDREDLFRLSRSIDDVLDNLRDFVREYDLLEAPEGALFAPVIAAIEEGLLRLRAAVRCILEDPAKLTRGAMLAKKSCNEVRHAYQRAIADLLNSGDVTLEVLKQRELLRRLDVVGLRLGEAADALADGAMKRSH